MLKSLRMCIAAAVLGAGGNATAGELADNLSKCLVTSTTEQDKTLLVQWMFTMMALHPQVKQLASISDERRNEVTKNTATLFQTLLTKTCREQARRAMKEEGPSTLESSFNALGQVAGSELFANPAVAAGLGGLLLYLDAPALTKALTE